MHTPHMHMPHMHMPLPRAVRRAHLLASDREEGALGRLLNQAHFLPVSQHTRFVHPKPIPRSPFARTQHRRRLTCPDESREERARVTVGGGVIRGMESLAVGFRFGFTSI